MDTLDNPGLRQQVQDFLKQQDDTLTWVETHGLLCAIACGPEVTADWQQLVCAEEDQAPPAEIVAALTLLAERLRSQLGAGEHLQLPCRLDPYEENDGRDLASWCTGFLAGIFIQEAAWYDRDEETVANWLLPFILIAGLEEDEQLDALWQDSKLVRQMALGIPELIEELFLHFSGAGSNSSEGDDEEE